MGEFVDIRIEKDNTQAVKEQLERGVLKGLEEIGIQVASLAADDLEEPPRRVDTGRLKNSITHKLAASEKAVYVGTNVEYAIYVNYGTKRMTPHPFLKNAIEKNQAEILAILKKNLES